LFRSPEHLGAPGRAQVRAPRRPRHPRRADRHRRGDPRQAGLGRLAVLHQSSGPELDRPGYRERHFRRHSGARGISGAGRCSSSSVENSRAVVHSSRFVTCGSGQRSTPMNLLHAAARRTLAVAVSAAAVPATAQAPATAAPAGSVISVTAQPDGWHGVSGGSVVEYWMSGSDGTPRPASGALLLPEGTPPPGGWPIIAYDHGTSGLGMGCGGMSTPETAPFPRLQGRQDQLLRRLVAQGFAVVAPDYLGLGTFDTGPHPYLELRTEATATIDMIRAVRATHPELSSTWAAFGISQGGQAALGTGHLQSTYAPELDFRGTIAVDPESDVEKLLPLAGPNIPELPVVDDALSFVVSILAGLREARPDIAVDQYLTPLGRTV